MIDKDILYFDGVCNLCNGFIDFLIRREQTLFFAPLQGETARTQLSAQVKANLDTVVFQLKGRIYFRSSAAIRALMHIGGFWRLMGFFLVLPTPVRDFIYDLVAKNRYKLFGRLDSCRLPSAAERARFLL